MKEIKVKCYCGGILFVTEDDLGCEVECPRCGTDFCVPESEEQVAEHNAESEQNHEEMRFTGKYRVMIEDECGTEQCIIDDADSAHLGWIVKGVQADYPEARRVFTERVENQRYMAEQFLLDENF
jgi:hypothetical protein